MSAQFAVRFIGFGINVLVRMANVPGSLGQRRCVSAIAGGCKATLGTLSALGSDLDGIRRLATGTLDHLVAGITAASTVGDPKILYNGTCEIESYQPAYTRMLRHRLRKSVTGLPRMRWAGTSDPFRPWARIGQLRSSSKFPSDGYADLNDRSRMA